MKMKENGNFYAMLKDTRLKRKSTPIFNLESTCNMASTKNHMVTTEMSFAAKIEFTETVSSSVDNKLEAV